MLKNSFVNTNLYVRTKTYKWAKSKIMKQWLHGEKNHHVKTIMRGKE